MSTYNIKTGQREEEVDPMFTPGPWRRIGRIVYALFIPDRPPYVDGHPLPRNRFSLLLSGDGSGVSDAELDANGNLIVKAPDLYAALKRVALELENAPIDVSIPTDPESKLSSIREALEQAWATLDAAGRRFKVIEP